MLAFNTSSEYDLVLIIMMVITLMKALNMYHVQSRNKHARWMKAEFCLWSEESNAPNSAAWTYPSVSPVSCLWDYFSNNLGVKIIPAMCNRHLLVVKIITVTGHRENKGVFLWLDHKDMSGPVSTGRHLILLHTANNKYLLTFFDIPFKSSPEDMLIDFRGEEGGERGRNNYVREKHWSIASHLWPDQGLGHNPGMCTDGESNPQPFGVRDDAATSWATLSGLFKML